MRDPRLTVARREWASLSREKTIVLALLVQLLVAGFSSFLVVGLASLYDPAATGGVTVAATGDAAGAFEDAAPEGLGVVSYPDAESAVAAFERGRVDAVVEAERVDGRVAVRATVPRESLRKTLVVVHLREALEALEREERLARSAHLEATPLPLPPEVRASPYFGFTYTVLVPLLCFLPVFISGSVAVDAVTEEVERGTLSLLRVAPVSLVAIVDGKALAAAALAPLSAALWLALLSLNGIAVANVAALLALVAALAAVATAAGVALSVAVPSRQSAQLLYSVGILAAFSLAALLPEHPATTVALLAVDSATLTTYAHLAVALVVAVAAAATVRRYVAAISPERL